MNTLLLDLYGVLYKTITFTLFYIYAFIILPFLCTFCYLIGATTNACDLNSFILQEFLQIRYIQLPYLNKKKEDKNKIVKEGVILTNHRSFADFIIDPYMFQCPAIGRRLASLFLLFGSINGISSNRLLCINRNNSREKIYSQLRKKKLFYFYPQGTRCKHLTLPQDYKDIILKPGLLKSIYEDKERSNNCIQVTIFKNKETIVNEKTLELGFRKNVIYCIGKPIYIKDYETFEEFFDEIKKEWKLLWDKVYGFDEAKWIEENDEKYDGLYGLEYFPFVVGREPPP